MACVKRPPTRRRPSRCQRRTSIGIQPSQVARPINQGAAVEAEWLLATYVQIGAVAARIIGHQGEEIFRVVRGEAAQAAPRQLIAAPP
jgi:hypothetical protein